MIPIIWDIGKFTWDTALPFFAASGIHTFEIFGIENVNIDGFAAIVFIRGCNATDHYDKINECAARFSRVVFFIYGDEEGIFQIDQLKHPNKIIWWAMPPIHQQTPDRAVILGWPIEAGSMILQAKSESRKYDWSFSGQVTNERRVSCVDALRKIPNGHIHETPGFRMGTDRAAFYRLLSASKMVPCPSGPITVDSYRFAEALECGAIPIADNVSPNPSFKVGYWNAVLGDDLPFPIINDWRTLPIVISEWLSDWEEKATTCQRWWLAKKQSWIDQMAEDVRVRKYCSNVPPVGN